MAISEGNLAKKNMEFPENLMDALQWSYRGEGGATIVVASQKKNIVLRLKKTRLASSLSTSSESDTSQTHSQTQSKRTECALDEETIHSLDFQKNVFQPLMGSEYVRVGSLVKIPPGFAAKMNEICLPARPAPRLDKMIDPERTVGVFMPDFCFLEKESGPSFPFCTEHTTSFVTQVNSSETSEHIPTFCVEIKPKCGYLPISPFVAVERGIKHDVCYYCMHQRLKVKEVKYSRESSYCPVDLFSGDVDRVVFALQSLVQDPQNNLRVFKDGCLIFSEELAKDGSISKATAYAEDYLEDSLQGLFQLNSSTSTHCEGKGSLKHYPNSRVLLEVLLQILVHDSGVLPSNDTTCISNNASFPSSQQCKKSKFDPHSSVQASAEVRKLAFQGRGVLQKLLAIQRLDDLEVEALHVLYRRVTRCFTEHPNLRDRTGIDGPYHSDIWKSTVSLSKASEDDVNGDHKRTLVTTSENSFHLCRNVMENGDSLQSEALFHFTMLKICQFLIASTAKDCSILVTFQKCHAPPTSSTTQWIQDVTSGIFYHYNIDLVDLDPKEFDRVPKYLNDSLNTVKHYS